MCPVISSLIHQLATLLQDEKKMLCTAESCTGGGVAYYLTSLAGVSTWFDRSFVTYSNEAKKEMLGVNEKTLLTFGAVSQETVKEMAEGALKNSHAQVSIAITGIAGPTGGSDEKPVGTVWFGFGREGVETVTHLAQLQGDREAIRTQSIEIALQKLVDLLDS